MKNYRIIEIKNKFYIQKRILFFWVYKSFPTGCVIPNYSNISVYLIILYRTYVFDSIDAAEKFLKKHEINKFKQRYFGDKIISVVDEITWDYLYVNVSKNFGFTYDEATAYEFSDSINVLTDKIDKRKGIK